MILASSHYPSFRTGSKNKTSATQGSEHVHQSHPRVTPSLDRRRPLQHPLRLRTDSVVVIDVAVAAARVSRPKHWHPLRPASTLQEMSSARRRNHRHQLLPQLQLPQRPVRYRFHWRSHPKRTGQEKWKTTESTRQHRRVPARTTPLPAPGEGTNHPPRCRSSLRRRRLRLPPKSPVR